MGSLHERQYTMTPVGVGNPIAIGAEGYLSATVTMDMTPIWPSFEVMTTDAILYVAGAAFADNVTDANGVMPTENAWRRLPHPITNGTLDPGINVSSDDLTVHYDFYDLIDFDGSGMDLYMRRGGVSGHLILPAGGATTNAFGYEDRVQGIELLFIDNGITKILQFDTDLYLPYPSDATLLLSADQANPAEGIPTSGGFRESTIVLHKYWNFTETPSSWQYNDVSVDYGTALGHGQDVVFALHDSEAPIDGLGSLDSGPESGPVELGFCSEWLPDGDIGALRLKPLAQLQYRVSGFYYVFSGLKLSRYYTTPMNHSSLPSTAGVDLTSNIDSLPEELLTTNGALTPQSLKLCSNGDTVGCGLVLIDGNVAVEYFGEVLKDTTLTLQGVGAVNLDVDDLVGVFPLAVNWFYTVTKQVGMFASIFPWSWPLVNRVLEVPLPVKFLGNTNGGVFVALLKQQDVFPNDKIFNSDIAAIVSMGWTPALGFEDKIGIFMGYAASQAAFRALAMNRPTFAGGVIPFDQWAGVSTDIQAWAAKFGYLELAGDENDAVDLARDTWDAWCDDWDGNTCPKANQKDFEQAYWIVQPLLKSLGGEEAYGVGGIEVGSDLLPINAELNTSAMGAIIVPDGLGLQVTKLEGGLQMQYGVYSYTPTIPFTLPVAIIDIFVRVDWVTVELNRDGELFFYGDTYINIVGDVGVDGEFYGFAVQDSNDDWLVEGTVDLETIGISGVAGLDLAGEFGSGIRNGHGVSYVGVRGEGYYLNYRIGGGFLFGGIYKESQILRDVGYGELLDTLGSDDTYTGFYAYLSGDFPIVDGTCAFNAVAGGELQLWYYWSHDVYGGILSGYVYATVACIISGRGQVDLEYAHLDNGGSISGRTCENPHCDAYSGTFWIAVGIGWCSPSTWDSWRERWWGDSWCYTFGVEVDISYLSPGGWDWHSDFDYE